MTRALNPPVLGRNPVFMDQFYVDAISDDFSRALIETRYPVEPDDAYVGPLGGLTDIYGAEPDGSFRWLTPAVTLPDEAGTRSSSAPRPRTSRRSSTGPRSRSRPTFRRALTSSCTRAAAMTSRC